LTHAAAAKPELHRYVEAIDVEKNDTKSEEFQEAKKKGIHVKYI